MKVKTLNKLIKETQEFNKETIKNLQIDYDNYFNYHINKEKPELPLSFENWLHMTSNFDRKTIIGDNSTNYRTGKPLQNIKYKINY